MKEQNPTRKDESIKTDNEICEMCAKESEEPEKILNRKKPDAAATARPQPVPRMSERS